MTRLLKIVLLALAVSAALSASASAVTIGQVAPSTTGDITSPTNRTFVQLATKPGAPSFLIPFDGVATSFSLRLGTLVAIGDNARFVTYENVSGSTYRPSADSGPIPIYNTDSSQVVTLPIRQTVMAGQFLGLGLHADGNTRGRYQPADSAITDHVQDFNGFPALGTGVINIANQFDRRINMSAVIEPDADHDGYGDETQDGCPVDRSDTGPCTAPAITEFKYSLSKFAVEKRGIVLSPAVTATGTNVIITLSKASRVTFEMSQKAPGRRVGSSCKKQTRKNRSSKKCTRYLKPYKFVRVLPSGTSNLGFSGRIKVGTKNVALPAGKYRATASPVSAASNIAGLPATTNFTVVKPAKKG